MNEATQAYRAAIDEARRGVRNEGNGARGRGRHSGAEPLIGGP